MPTVRANPDVANRVLETAFWTVVLFLVATLHTDATWQANPTLSQQRLLLEFLGLAAVGALCLPAAAWLHGRFRLDAGNWMLSVLVHTLAAIAFGGILLGAAIGYRSITAADIAPGSLTPLLLHSFCYWWLIVVVLWAYTRLGDETDDDEALQLPLDLARSSPGTPGSAGGTQFLVQGRKGEIAIEMAEVNWIQAAGKKVILHLRNGSYRLDESMHALEQRLDHRFFVRVHRSRMVNLDRIATIRPWLHGDSRIVLQDGTVINFSRRYRSRLEQLS